MLRIFAYMEWIPRYLKPEFPTYRSTLWRRGIDEASLQVEIQSVITTSAVEPKGRYGPKPSFLQHKATFFCSSTEFSTSSTSVGLALPANYRHYSTKSYEPLSIRPPKWRQTTETIAVRVSFALAPRRHYQHYRTIIR